MMRVMPWQRGRHACRLTTCRDHSLGNPGMMRVMPWQRGRHACRLTTCRDHSLGNPGMMRVMPWQRDRHACRLTTCRDSLGNPGMMRVMPWSTCRHAAPFATASPASFRIFQAVISAGCQPAGMPAPRGKQQNHDHPPCELFAAMLWGKHGSLSEKANSHHAGYMSQPLLLCYVLSGAFGWMCLGSHPIGSSIFCC